MDADDWAATLVVCGMWANAKEKLLPSLMLGAAAVNDLEQALLADESFRQDLVAASAKDLPAKQSAVGDLAGWLLQHVAESRRTKHRSIEAAMQTGNMHPSNLLGDVAAQELVAYDHTSDCMLDVESYRKAMEKFGEETEAVEKQWRELRSVFRQI